MKTKLGISVGLTGALVVAIAGFGNYTAMALVAAYVFLVEDNAWLKKTMINVMVLVVSVSMLSYAIGIIPDVINWLCSIINLLGTHLYFDLLSSLENVIVNGLNLAKNLLLLVMAVKALNQGTVKIPVISKLFEE